jgi:hypothetical protein
MPNATALDAMQTRIEVLELQIAELIESREADNARWKQLVDAVSADRDRWQAEVDAKHRAYKRLWESRDGEDGQ